MENKTAEDTIELGKHMSAAFDKWKTENEDCFVGPVGDKYLFNRLWLAFMRGGDATEYILKKRIEELEAQVIDLNGLASLATVTQLLDKLDYATEMLKEAQDTNFNSNLGARIKAFIPNPSTNGK